jgi:uncharacterized spore protein YtfJ
MEPQEVLKTLVDQLRSIARTETIVSEPITVAGKTIIPISRIVLGFGGGGGQPVAGVKNSGPGGGGGAGLKIEPAAFILIDQDKVSVLAVPHPKGDIESVIESIPNLIENLADLRTKWREGKRTAKTTSETSNE